MLRPFHTSTTYQNLKARGEGVFHVTDDVLAPGADGDRRGPVAGARHASRPT